MGRHHIGIVGAGKIVEESHLPAYAKQGWKVAAIASRSMSSATRVADLFGIPVATDDISRIIEDDGIDVVDISLPPHLHRGVCEAAFAAGKHVLVQKPMATTLEDATAIVEAAERAGCTLAVNQNGRWDPAIRACKELLDRNAFGPMVVATMELRTRQPWQSFWEDPERYPRLMMLGMSIHHLDQFRYLFGEPETVTAVTHTYPGQPWAGDSIAFYALRYADGLLAVGLDDGFPWTSEWLVRFRLEGLEAIAHGDIGWPRGDYSTLRYTYRTDPDHWIEPTFEDKWFPDAFAGTMGELLRAIDAGDEPSISGRDNLNTMRLVEAAYRSAESGRTVDMKDVP